MARLSYSSVCKNNHARHDVGITASSCGTAKRWKQLSAQIEQEAHVFLCLESLTRGWYWVQIAKQSVTVAFKRNLV